MDKHCTEQENAAKKVEQQVGTSAAAMLLEARIGESFNAIIRVQLVGTDVEQGQSRLRTPCGLSVIGFL